MSIPDLSPLESTALAVRESNEAREKRLAAAPPRKPPLIPKGMKPGEYIEQEYRKFLEAPDPKGKIRLLELINAQYNRALSTRYGAGDTIAMLERAYRKPKPSEEEADAIKRGFQFVILNNPELTDVPEKEQLPESRPEFVDAEVVSTEPKQEENSAG